MLNFAPLPDLLALTILVFVFWSILRRRAGGKLQAWFWAGSLFCCILRRNCSAAGPAGLQTFVYAVSAMMLELAGAAFIYAAGGAYYSLRMRWIAATGLLATLLYILIDYLSITTPSWYFATAALLLGSVIAALVRDPDSRAGERHSYAVLAFVLVVLLCLAVHYRQQDYGLDCIFFVIYLMAGVEYWRKFPHRTTGSLTAVVGLGGVGACVSGQRLYHDIPAGPSHSRLGLESSEIYCRHRNSI